MNVLALTRYARLGASSRVRFYQMLPTLQAHGINVTVAPLSSDAYVRELYAGKGRRPARIAADYAGRLIQLLSIGRFDLLWIEKELLPGAPALLERLLAALRIPYVVDYDDATFHRYDQSSNPLVRKLPRVQDRRGHAACRPGHRGQRVSRRAGAHSGRALGRAGADRRGPRSVRGAGAKGRPAGDDRLDGHARHPAISRPGQ